MRKFQKVTKSLLKDKYLEDPKRAQDLTARIFKKRILTQFQENNDLEECKRFLLRESPGQYTYERISLIVDTLMLEMIEENLIDENRKVLVNLEEYSKTISSLLKEWNLDNLGENFES